jgi:hypothetical protein
MYVADKRQENTSLTTSTPPLAAYMKRREKEMRKLIERER